MSFFGVGSIELLFVGLIAFLVLGPTRLTELAKNLGKVMREVRRATSQFTSLMDEDPPKKPPVPPERDEDR